MTLTQFKRMWRPVAALALVALVILALMFRGATRPPQEASYHLAW